ncbi:MAG TPA: hypothetical protein VMF58_07645 [Rhizomicrobium sp.]|nr:hypothetical protein [Rhizomicrobium sp.]
MKHSFAEFSCIALLWTGTAGVVASLYIGHTHTVQIQSLCAFSSVIAMGCIAKFLLANEKSLSDKVG